LPPSFLVCYLIYYPALFFVKFINCYSVGYNYAIEGIIPKGNYGAGTVIVWDTGTYNTPGDDISDQFKNGKITFT
jgi:hypothetical protein